MSSNVGGSAGDQGFQFQAKIIAFVAVHILAEARLTGLEQDIDGIPIAVAAETNGPGDDIRIEFDRPKHYIELQAKKGLRVDDRFNKTIEKIADGLHRDTTSSVLLAVDPTATSQIRQKLPRDLRRLRQNRDDTPHDRNLLNRVVQMFAAHAEGEEETRALARHLFVHTFDVEKYDLQTALNLLRSRILVDERQAKAAWNLLVQAGHELISERGRYDATSLVRFIQRESGHTILLRAALLPVDKNRYQTWLAANTATFRIPGPAGARLPIETAWTELRVLAKQEAAPPQDIEEILRRYYEWERLAVGSAHDGYHAKDVAEVGYRVVIVGGPGAGKSTLCRKLAHDLTGYEEVVMWVHLRTVANRIQNGMDINSALVDVAVDGFDASLDVREALFAQVDCLIADGLEECGDLVVSVAEAMQRWATAHPFTRIVITSRPIGYEAAYFPEWEHYDLMPLTQDQVRSSSWELIKTLAQDAAIVEKHAAQFQEQLKHNRVASLAARNPLLMGFLIQLSLQGEALAQERAGLYGQILDLWRVSLPADRTWQVPQIDELLAWRSLEIAGWVLLHPEKGRAAGSRIQLVQQMSQRLAEEMGTRLLQASAVAGNCLQFWHERGVLDRLQVGHQEIYTFVHATLNEYAAGRYLASLNLHEIRQLVRDKYRDPRWREPILLAAGCGAVQAIVETLLDMYAEDEQAPPALYLAAAAVADAPTAPATLAQAVAYRLSALLTSDNATAVYETAEHGVSLVKRVPDLFTPLLRPLFKHAQEWTRFSALYLALESKAGMIGADELEVLLQDLTSEDLSPRKRKAAYKRQGKVVISVGWDLQNKMIVRGAEMLASMRPDAKTRGLLQNLYENNHAVSMGTHLELRRVLLELGCDEFLKERDRREEEKVKGSIFDPIVMQYQAEADRKVLETILRLTSSRLPLAKKRSKLRALTVLFHALQYPETPVQDWLVLGRLDDMQAIEAVLSGYIEALDLNKEELAQDAAWALAELQKLHLEGTGWKSLLSLLPNFPVNPEIPKRASLIVQREVLLRAVHHPSVVVADGAAQLLAAAGEGKVELASLLLSTSDARLLAILAAIAGRLWEAEARPLLLKRLDQGLMPGSWLLLEELPSLQGEHTDQRFQQTLLNALQAEEPCIAIAAVHALQQLDISLLREMIPVIRAVLLYWMGQGERAKASSYYIVDGCPTCRTEPGNAYAHLSHLTDRLSL